MNDNPPDPPPLPNEQVEALIAWLDATAEWIRDDHAVARAHGHHIRAESMANLRRYEDSSVLFREAYGLIGPE